MEDVVLSPGTMLGVPADSAMDFDYMDELLLEGCWLETTDGFDCLNPTPSVSATFLDPAFLLPTLEANIGDSTSSPSQKGNEEDNQTPWFHENSPLRELQTVTPVNTLSLGDNMVSVTGCGNNATEGSEVGRRWWIGPRANPGSGTSVKKRLVRALEYIKDLAKDEDVLIQIWVPVNRGGRRVLTTHDQPFALNPGSERLANYRGVSVNYQFSAEGDSKDLLGLPGRVFLGKVPEWTPDVRFFKIDEYPRLNHAQQYDVRGTLALPVFEQGSRTCLGVIEVVTTTQKIQYRPELESVCKALEAVDLRSSEVLSAQNLKACHVSYEAALPEIREVLKSACETHRLPLAQTWVPCVHQGKAGCRHSAENYLCCVSTVDHACYVADDSIQPFHEACSEHHLLKGQGVAGGAFMTNQPCFESNITSFGKTEYPLSHHARIFGLHAAVAIRLRSMLTGATDFVLEFFLPIDCKDPEEQKEMLTSLSIIIQQACHTLRVVTDKELEEETDFLVSRMAVPSDRSGREETLRLKYPHSERLAKVDSSWSAHVAEIQKSGNVVSVSQNEQQKVMLSNKSAGCLENQKDYNLKEGVEIVSMSKTGVKRHTKIEKAITLQVLRQYFAGSLKDAAKSIGVCPTTLKRICRQHGITRWPSRKIKKVGHSLQKLQLVIDSVQETSGTVQIGSFYRNFPELDSSNLPKTSIFSTSEMSDHSKPSFMQPDECIAVSYVGTPKSPSTSCSQSSSSSHCCSSGMQQSASVFTVAAGKKNADNGVLKRVRSNTELHGSNQVEEKLLPRSQSLEALKEHPNMSNLPQLPRHNSQLSQEMDAHRVKISYGNENIRFRMPNSWRYEDLLQEIVRRFNIDDISMFDLKYLDDDSEWVLLTCDDDLMECIDISRSSHTPTIKLSLQVSPHLLGSSLCSKGPL